MPSAAAVDFPNSLQKSRTNRTAGQTCTSARSPMGLKCEIAIGEAPRHEVSMGESVLLCCCLCTSARQTEN